MTALPAQAALVDFSPLESALLSALVVAVAVGVWVGVRRLAEAVRGDFSQRLVDVLLAVVLLLLLVGTSGTLVVFWEVEAQVLQLLQALQPSIEVGVRVVVSLGLFVFVYVATGVVHRMVNNFVKEREDITDHQAEVSFRVLQITIYLSFVLAVLGLWEINLSGLLIGAGFAGIILGMAARQTLGALLAGFVLMFSRPFEIGDWVEIGDNEGIVTDITIVNTRIQSFDGEYVILPNDYVGSEEIINRSRKGRLRLHVQVGVDYDTDVDRALDVAADTMKEVDDVLSVPRPQAVLTEFGGSSIGIGLRFWIDKPSARRKWRAQTAVISAVHSAFREENIKIPFPQREMSSRPEAGGFHVDSPSEGVGVREADADAGSGDAERESGGRSE
ncbi:mechanosensitive ion channel family protein [Halocalculus aciditolerans]|uniref:Mechanosensitive ion channel protein MscS n=1 Tax=Halocalculus aciditolerans TaxID=1383812 RepID=A0A830FK80_9EURY|nr:mechanosensitive ion channel family protein [Halocalculus aciditolerans]GGL54788.1 mechanosensitive ion channel protein MscS [Halocalculus aciditolerans]